MFSHTEIKSSVEVQVSSLKGFKLTKGLRKLVIHHSYSSKNQEKVSTSSTGFSSTILELINLAVTRDWASLRILNIITKEQQMLFSHTEIKSSVEAQVSSLKGFKLTKRP